MYLPVPVPPTGIQQMTVKLLAVLARNPALQKTKFRLIPKHQMEKSQINIQKNWSCLGHPVKSMICVQVSTESRTSLRVAVASWSE